MSEINIEERVGSEFCGVKPKEIRKATSGAASPPRIKRQRKNFNPNGPGQRGKPRYDGMELQVERIWFRRETSFSP